MSDHETLRLLQREEQRLRDKLAADPTFQKLQHIQKLIALYDAESESKGISRPPVRLGARTDVLRGGRQAPSETKTAAIDRITCDYLRKKGRRAFSGEIMEVIKAEGVKIGGRVPSRVLASFLSNSDLFDNVRGEGYGLKEWGGDPPKKDEAPPRDPEGASLFVDEGSRPSSNQTEDS